MSILQQESNQRQARQSPDKMQIPYNKTKKSNEETLQKYEIQKTKGEIIIYLWKGR